MDSKKVTLEGKEYEIQRFKGYKAVLAIALISRIGRKVPEVIAKATREFRRNNSLEITPMMAKLGQWAGNSFEEEDFAKGGGHIEVPAPMTVQEQVFAALPDLIDGASDEVFKLLALMLTSNAELRIADKKDSVHSLLEAKAEPLYEADLEDLAELLIVTIETIQDQVGDKGDRLGKTLGRLPWISRLFQTQTSKSEEQTQKTQTPDAQSSSTDSVTLTDGLVQTPSSEPLGVN